MQIFMLDYATFREITRLHFWVVKTALLMLWKGSLGVTPWSVSCRPATGRVGCLLENNRGLFFLHFCDCDSFTSFT